MPRTAAMLCCALALLLCGCPAKDKGAMPVAGGGPASHASEPLQIEPGDYPPAALDYLLAALKSPTEGYPALGVSWGIVAQLTKLGDAKGKAAEQIRALVAKQVKDAGDNPPPEVVGAWLATTPADARKFLEKQFKSGGWQYMSSLWFQPQLARQLFADPAGRVVQPKDLSADAAHRWLDLIRFWDDLSPADEDLLNAISNRQGEPENSLRASGYLLQLFPDDKVLLKYLETAERSALATQADVLSGAAEGIRLSHSGNFTDAVIGKLAPVLIKQGKVVPQASPAQLYAAYALAYLPGDEAAHARLKLLESKDSTIQWHARLGQLLHGDTKPWDAAVTGKDGLASPELWTALVPPDAVSPALLPTYAKAAKSDDPAMRLHAATHLARYGAYAGQPDVVELLASLQKDKVEAVREAAWYSAGKLGVSTDGALSVLGDGKEASPIRLAAGFAALMQAQGGAPVGVKRPVEAR